jgi:hypothetical protein
MDDQSTPIESLNNNNIDDTQVVNNILSKYNNLQDGQTSIPALNNNIPIMEQQFENRDLNQEIYKLNGNNVAYNEHYQKEIQRTNQHNKQNNIQYEDDDEQYEDEYDEYINVEIPLWKRVLNEIRIPFFIFIFILFISNCTFDKFLLNKLPLLGNKFNECNTYGFLLKALLISILSYIFIRFIRV